MVAAHPWGGGGTGGDCQQGQTQSNQQGVCLHEQESVTHCYSLHGCILDG